MNGFAKDSREGWQQRAERQGTERPQTQPCLTPYPTEGGRNLIDVPACANPSSNPEVFSVPNPIIRHPLIDADAYKDLLLSPSVLLSLSPTPSYHSRALTHRRPLTMNRIASVKLAPAQGSFPFEPKALTFTSEGPSVMLGVPPPKTRVSPSSHNGLFAPLHNTILPLTLAVTHAELYLEGNKVVIRDLDSPFGTFVNGQQIREAAPLKVGDVITLGKRISRNAKTPPDITDDQLRPILMRVTLISA